MRGGSKLVWALVIVFVNVIGPDRLLHRRAGGRDDGAASRPATPRAVVARGLTKRFGAVLALDGLDLDVPAGSIFGLLGPNGAGKTTTIRILTGLARPSGGHGDGRRRRRRRSTGRRLRRRLGYLDQDPRFYGWMTGPRAARAGRPAGRARGRRSSATRVARCSSGRACADARERRIGGYSRRDAAAARDRPGPDPRAGAAVPRRAGELARPRGPARPARADRGAPRRGDGRSSRPTSSPTSSGSATASRSSTAAGS